MKVRPLHDRILVKRVEEETKSKGGIIIPDTAKEKPQEGRVIAVGNGKMLENGTTHALEVGKGDRVVEVTRGGGEGGAPARDPIAGAQAELQFDYD